MGITSKIREGWRGCWTWLSHASTAITFLQIFGWWPWVLGAVGLVGGMITGITNDVPLAFIILAAGMGFAMLFTLTLCWKYAKEKHAEQNAATLDGTWDHVDEFMVFQAACLWVGREPKRPVPRRAYATFTMIKTALHTGAIHASNPQAGIDQFVRVNRAELRKLAESKGLKPRFLFPDG